MLNIFNKPHADPILLPLASGWWPILSIIGIYLYFVLRLGPQFMAHRQPYDLKKALKVYNVLQIIFNFTCFLAGTYYIFWVQIYDDFSCLTIKPLDHPLKSIERAFAYAYYLNKILDLTDTIFIVLRKSYRQVTALHLIHHVYMALGTYILIKYHGYGGHPVATGYANIIVHTFMYGYYYLASQYPHIKGSLWWKKYITIVQMVQFLLIFAHSAWTYMQSDCDVQPFLIYVGFFMPSLMFVMFANFYIKSYIRPNKKSAQKKTN